MLRAIQAHAGLTREQIVANPQKARQKFMDIEDLFDMVRRVGTAISHITGGVG
ncbi:MAG: hypothetical protein HN719_01035 [Alphaproteobacteria bacterium]|nr:hypothetical protein [Alphaproteobacteria bacterium]